LSCDNSGGTFNGGGTEISSGIILLSLSAGLIPPANSNRHPHQTIPRRTLQDLFLGSSYDLPQRYFGPVSLRPAGLDAANLADSALAAQLGHQTAPPAVMWWRFQNLMQIVCRESVELHGTKPIEGLVNPITFQSG
jgi:hypothetical protein